MRFARDPCTGCGAPHGRPVLPGNPLAFSLSYGAGRVLIALARTPVGVDIEALVRPSAAACTVRLEAA